MNKHFLLSLIVLLFSTSCTAADAEPLCTVILVNAGEGKPTLVTLGVVQFSVNQPCPLESNNIKSFLQYVVDQHAIPGDADAAFRAYIAGSQEAIDITIVNK